MKKLLLLGAALTAGAIGMQDVSIGHGGTYRGPGDTVPPGGGGGGGGGGPSTPGPAGPSAPGPSGPSTPGPAAPGAPGGGPSGPARPSTGGGQQGPDLTTWQYWWGFNKEPYLNLRAAIRGGGVQTGSDTFFLGHGQQDQAKDSMAPSEETIRQKIVPALVKALQGETNNDIVTACLVALGKIGDATSEEGESEFQKLIEARLTDPVQEIRETAAVALGILANPASVALLEGILLETPEAKKRLNEEGGINYRTRAFAAYGLGLIGFRTEDPAVREGIVKTLVEILESPRFATRDIKVAALIAMGLVPLDVREAALEEDEVENPWSSRQAQIAYLMEFFNDERSKDRGYLVRAHAPRAIAMLLQGAPPELRQAGVDALLKYVGKSVPGEVELRQSCTLALGLVGDLDDDKADADIRKKLIACKGNADQQTKYFRLVALAQIGGRPGEGESPMAGDEEVMKELTHALTKGKGNEKPWAGLAMGVYQRGLLDGERDQNSEALGYMRQALEKEGTQDYIGAYALGLGIARDLDSQDALLEKLENTSQDQPRGDIAVALGLMNSVAAKEKIQEIVKASKYRSDLLKNAAIALGLLGDQGIVTELVSMLKDEAKTLATQAAIASALGFIGDSRSVDPLIDMLENTELTDRARAFAAVALGIVADKEQFPWNTKISTDLNYRATTTTLTSFSSGTGILDIL